MTAFDDFISLCATAGRPLVFFDFEATGLTDDARPCEFACVVLDTREEASEDETTAAVRRDLARPDVPCGAPGSYGAPVAYAVASRLNPGMKIQPGATAIHGISIVDVADSSVPMFDDPDVIDLFRAYEDAGAIFCGHNVAGYDLLMARRLGYVDTPPCLDTHRMVRRFAESHPMPPAWDPTSPSNAHPVPVCDGGLKVFRGDLSSLHYALTGWTFEGAHGALADVTANVRVFGRLIDLWFPADESAETLRQIGGDADKARRAVDAIVAAMNTPPPSEVGWSGWLRRHTIDGVEHVEVMKGKNRGRSVADVSASDLEWIAGLPDTDDRTVTFIRETVASRYSGRPSPSPSTRPRVRR